MSHPSTLPPAKTFVLRFWWERSPVPHWRGQITHLESGQKIAFLDMEKMVRFIRGLGIMADGEAGPADGPASPADAAGRPEAAP
jgi:hypothetical protein